MADLHESEKLRILELRTSESSKGRHPKPWDEVAADSRHSKATVIQVGRWFQALPWADVGSFPEAVQQLRDDYLAHLKGAITSDRIEVYTTKVGPVPDVPTRYENPLGVKPTWVGVTSTDYGTPAPIHVGTVTDRFVELRAASGHSGAIGFIRLESNPKGSLPWLRVKDSDRTSEQERRPGG